MITKKQMRAAVENFLANAPGPRASGKTQKPIDDTLPLLVPGVLVAVGAHANRVKKNWMPSANTGNGKPWEDEVEIILKKEQGKVERFTSKDSVAIGSDFLVTGFKYKGRIVNKYSDAKVVVRFPANEVARIKKCFKDGDLYEVLERGVGRYYVTPNMLRDDGARVLSYRMKRVTAQETE